MLQWQTFQQMASRRAPKKLSADELWDYALRLLAGRPYSAGELRQKLSRRAVSPADVSAALNKLKEYGLADDVKFSETFAASRLQNEGFGRFRVLRDLRGRRVSATVAEQAVSKTFAGKDELDLVERFLARKYRGKDLHAFLQEEKNLASAYRRLRTAGFSSSASLGALKRHSNRVDDWSEPEEEEPE